MPKLNVTLPDGTASSYELVEDEITIGRTADNTIQIDDISVSSHHAALRLADGSYIYQDIGSTNGSRLNGKDIPAETDHPLSAGDVLRIGKIEAAYESENPADAQPLPAEQTADLATASASVRPADFANASRFEKKTKKKDPAGKMVMALAVVAILAFCAAVASIFTMKSPL
ncbi:MAG: FHA domain-containing protein [Chthoniobacteraceae bacterium]